MIHRKWSVGSSQLGVWRLPRRFAPRNDMLMIDDRVILAILDPFEAQAGGRGEMTGGRTVVSRQDVGDVFGTPMAAPNVDERSGDEADHVMEKAIPFHLDGDPVAIVGTARCDIAAEHRPYGVSIFVDGVREGAEIMCSHEVLGRSLHRFDRQRGREVPAEPDLADRTKPAGVDGVAVGLARDLCHHVEVRADLLSAEHDDILGQPVVESQGKMIYGDRVARLEQTHLPPCMDAGIRPAGPLHVGRAAQQRGSRLTERALDRAQARLNLPAVILRAVVRQHELDLTPERPGRRRIRNGHLQEQRTEAASASATDYLTSGVLSKLKSKEKSAACGRHSAAIQVSA